MKKRNIIEQLDFCMIEINNLQNPEQLRKDYLAISKHLIGEIDSAVESWRMLSGIYKKRLDVYERKN